MLGHYERDDGRGWLIVVDYPSDADAGRAEASARETGLAAARKDTRLAAVLEPEPDDFSEELLAEAVGGNHE